MNYIDHTEYIRAGDSIGIAEDDMPMVLRSGSGRVFTGSNWPSFFAKLRFPGVDTDGKNIIRISQNNAALPERQNLTLAHELIHESQSAKFRNLGRSIQYATAISTAYLGYTMGGSSKTLGAVGFTVGMRVGWRIAPHEIQARRLAPGLAVRYEMIKRRSEEKDV